jgi:hypothetical protein
MGVNKGVNIPPRGQISPLGARGEVKNGPLVTLKPIQFDYKSGEGNFWRQDLLKKINFSGVAGSA